MNKLIILVFSLTFFSCNQRASEHQTSIERFEDVLGAQEVIYLDEIISGLDTYLETNYSDRELKFKSFLIDMREGNVNDHWEIDSIKITKYRKSHLFNKYDEIYPDSVWFDGQTFVSRFLEIELVAEMIPIRKRGEALDIDSTITALKNEPELYLKEIGQFYIALDTIQMSDSLIIKYLDAKDAAGSISPSLIAGGLNYSLNEGNEYFAKRIFVMDMYEK